MPRERTAGRRSEPAKKSRRLHGAAARERVDQELEAQKAKAEARKADMNKPFRFHMKPGETKEVIIVDDAPDFMIYEHTGLIDPRTGHWSLNLQCIKDYENCAVCEKAEKESTYNLYLTVIDLSEFSRRDGTVEEFSRKLMVVKTGQIKKFTRRYEKDGTLRGARFELSRDGQRDPVIGNDIEYIEHVPEEELETYVREWTDREGKKHTEDCSQPYDYDEMFPELEAEELEEQVAEIWGEEVEPPAGSKRANERASTSRRRARDEDEDEDEKEIEDEDEDTEPPFDMEEDEDEEPEEKPRRRTASRTTRKRAAASDDDGDAEEDDDEPRTRRRPTARRRSR